MSDSRARRVSLAATKKASFEKKFVNDFGANLAVSH